MFQRNFCTVVNKDAAVLFSDNKEAVSVFNLAVVDVGVTTRFY